MRRKSIFLGSRRERPLLHGHISSRKGRKIMGEFQQHVQRRIIYGIMWMNQNSGGSRKNNDINCSHDH